jgi:hypothetical protein
VICVAGLVHQQFPLDSGAPKRPYQNYFVGQYVHLLLDVYSSVPLLALTKPSECILPSGLARAAESHVCPVRLSEHHLIWCLVENENRNGSQRTSSTDVSDLQVSIVGSRRDYCPWWVHFRRNIVWFVYHSHRRVMTCACLAWSYFSRVVKNWKWVWQLRRSVVYIALSMAKQK